MESQPEIAKISAPSGIKSFFTKRNIAILLVVLVGITYYGYKQKLFTKFLKKKK
jgi:hypothetical protein